MKKLYALCYGVILLCIVGTAILLIFTPDTIPVHYNFAGEVDRFGSKYENLIWPIFTITMGAFFILLAKQKRKKGETVNEKILLYTGICTLLFFAALGFYFMLKAIRYDPDAAATVSIDVISLLVLQSVYCSSYSEISCLKCGEMRCLVCGLSGV
mgnify:CR=1 FL=1